MCDFVFLLVMCIMLFFNEIWVFLSVISLVVCSLFVYISFRMVWLCMFKGLEIFGVISSFFIWCLVSSFGFCMGCLELMSFSVGFEVMWFLWIV